MPVDGKGKTGEGEHWSFIVKGAQRGFRRDSGEFACRATQPG
jgi:hypothetical protein